MNYFLLFLLTAFLWFWFDRLIKAINLAKAAGKRACLDAGVQFLDDTVAGISLGLARHISGCLTLRRIYRFEFSDTGDRRLEGGVALFGGTAESVTMEPHRL